MSGDRFDLTNDKFTTGLGGLRKVPEGTSSHDILYRFDAFHECNPQVYKRLCDMSWIIRKRQGRDKCAIEFFTSLLRWNTYMETNTIEPFRISQDFRAVYARKIMAEAGPLRGLFDLRRSIADKRYGHLDLMTPIPDSIFGG
jgi:hypothetical protein